MMASDNQLLNKIKEDLHKSGFISELRAANIAKSKEWRVKFNSNYLDLDTGKSREFDLDVSNAFVTHPEFSLHIQLNIEVKKSKRPWVIFTEDISKTKYQSHSPGFGIITAFDNFSTAEVLDVKGLMEGFMRSEKSYLGRNFCEAFKDPDEPSKIFEALISISKASLYSRELNMLPQAKEQQDDPTMHYDPELPCYYHIIQPLVVLDGKLVGAKLNEEDEIVLMDSNYIPLELEYTSEKYQHKRFYPDIITLDYLGEYLDRTKSWGNQIINNVKR